jgi:anti-sigma-K factor RskA
MPARDDEDWVGTPPEGHHTRDRQAPRGYWQNQWQAVVATSILAVVVLLAVVLILVL